MKRKFEVGDRVVAYDYFGDDEHKVIGTIDETECLGFLNVVSIYLDEKYRTDAVSHWIAHVKLCRHLKPKLKQKPREVWITNSEVEKILNNGELVTNDVQVSKVKIIGNDRLFREVLPKRKK